jgi:LPXTG-site transpeptidase (sortase) family protein
VVSSLVATGAWLLAVAILGYTEAGQAQAEFEKTLGASTPVALTPGGSAPAAPFPWRLAVPRLGLSVAVMEGASERTLAVAAGHILGTRRPGDRGTIAIAAHRDTLFRPLRAVRLGDLVRIDTAGGRFDYVVESIRVVRPNDTSVLRSNDADALVLVTCFPFTFIGPAPNRFLVKCVPLRPSDSVAPAQRRQSASLPRAPT